MTTVLELVPTRDLRDLRRALQGLGIQGEVCRTADAAVFVVSPISPPVPAELLASLDGVARVLASSSPHPRLDALAWSPVRVRSDLFIGPGAPPVLSAGPCSAESREQVDACAAMAARAGARLLRGGAFKPRTSPYSFRGVGVEALAWLRASADRYGLAVVTEVMAVDHLEAVAEHADLIQIGARQMQAFSLLRAVGETGRPVLLKRGPSASLADWRLAAEHLLVAGASGVVFCERGIATAETELRNTLDLAAATLMRQSLGFAVIADPSHATGRRDIIAPLSRAALAAGLDGVMVEFHPDAAQALSDGPQALSPSELTTLSESLGPWLSPSSVERARLSSALEGGVGAVGQEVAPC